MSNDEGRPVTPYRSGGGLSVPSVLAPAPIYERCAVCGGTHPRYHSCLGPVEPPRPPLRVVRPLADEPKVLGVGRDATSERALIIYFDKTPSDADMRRIHDLLR